MASDFVIDALTRFTYRCNEVLDRQVLGVDLIGLEGLRIVEIGHEDHVIRGFEAGLRHAYFEVPLARNNAATGFEFGFQLDDVFLARAALGAFLQLPHDDMS